LPAAIVHAHIENNGYPRVAFYKIATMQKEKIMKQNQLTVLAFGICLLFLTLPPTVWATDGQIKIGQPAAGESYPILIDHAGSYVLTDNLVVGGTDAIRIQANDVTLDLNGHTIQGPSTGFNYGIWAFNQYSITILNGRVWGFGGNGVYLFSNANDPSHRSAGHIVKDMQLLNNGVGIGINGGVVLNCVANGNVGNGIVALFSCVHNCMTNKNAEGLYLDESNASGITSISNSGVGIRAIDSRVDNAVANGNGSAGINSSGSSVANCTARNNSGGGILAANSRIENNLVSNNQNYGLSINSANNFVIKNTGSTNTPGNISAYPAGSYVPLIGSDNANVFF
jgi:hypothetical protein